MRISAGAFEDMIGELVELRDQDHVVVLLDLLGRKVRAHIEAVSKPPEPALGLRRRQFS